MRIWWNTTYAWPELPPPIELCVFGSKRFSAFPSKCVDMLAHLNEKKWTKKRFNSKAEWENEIYRNECSIRIEWTKLADHHFAVRFKRNYGALVILCISLLNLYAHKRFYVCIVLLLNSPIIIIIVIDITFIAHVSGI